MKHQRIIAIGDPHGCLYLLKELVEEVIQFNPKHDLLVVLGDMIDRVSDSKGVVLYLQDLRQNYPDNIVLLKGNHEDMAYHFLNKTENLKQWLHATMWLANGGDKTLSNFESLDEAKALLLPFIESLDIYYQTDTHLFVHGGIPNGKDLKTVTQEELFWDRSLSYHGSKTLIVGHTPQAKVTRKGNVICIDTEAYCTGVLSGFDVLNNRIYQTCSQKKNMEITMEEESPCRGCQRGYCYVDEFCMRCKGTGKVVDFAVGLGPAGLLPSYVEISCPECHGVGFIRHFCPVYWNED